MVCIRTRKIQFFKHLMQAGSRPCTAWKGKNIRPFTIIQHSLLSMIIIREFRIVPRRKCAEARQPPCLIDLSIDLSSSHWPFRHGVGCCKAVKFKTGLDHLDGSPGPFSQPLERVENLWIGDCSEACLKCCDEIILRDIQ